MKKKVSVVVPCYNAARYLKKCIEYLLCQTIGIENMEVILVDDASTDDGETWKVITEFEARYPDSILAVSLGQNMRQGGTRNVGVSYASGEYLVFCDADDWLLEETLEHCYDAAEKYNADVVEFLIKNINDHESFVGLEKAGESYLIELDTEKQRKGFLLDTSVQLSLGSQKKLYRLSLIQENHIKFVEHRIFEEPSFMLPVRLYEKRHYFLNEYLYICYLSLDSTVRGEWGEHKWDNPKVWMHIMEELTERHSLEKYYEELEYLFFRHGFSLSVRMAVQKGYVLAKEELEFLVNMMLRQFPDVRDNQYVRSDVSNRTWLRLMITLLDLNFTEESVQVVNEMLRKYV